MFRCLVENALKDLEKQRLEHEKSPENHPLYPEEWKIFWNRRYKELQAGLYFHQCEYISMWIESQHDWNKIHKTIYSYLKYMHVKNYLKHCPTFGFCRILFVL